MNTRKYEQLKEFMKQEIRDGKWHAGEKIPIESSLCEQFGVSMATVKKAKHDLVAEGVLEIFAGRKGVFVRENGQKRSAGLVGVAIDTVKDRFRASMLQGIEDKLWEHKLHTILCNINYDHEKVTAYFESLFQNDIAGVIFSPVKGAGYLEQNKKKLDLLAAHHLPYVLLDRHLPNFSANTVVSDNWQSSKALTNALLQQGHSRILVVIGAECSSIHDRLQGHLEALREAGIAPDERLLIRNDDVLLRFSNPAQQAHELERLHHQIKQAGEFTVCYAMNVRLLQAAIQAFAQDRATTANVPREFVTYDEVPHELREFTDRARVVKQPGYQMGWEAARVLIESIQNPTRPIVQITLTSDIIEEIL